MHLQKRAEAEEREGSCFARYSLMMKVTEGFESSHCFRKRGWCDGTLWCVKFSSHQTTVTKESERFWPEQCIVHVKAMDLHKRFIYYDYCLSLSLPSWFFYLIGCSFFTLSLHKVLFVLIILSWFQRCYLSHLLLVSLSVGLPHTHAH